MEKERMNKMRLGDEASFKALYQDCHQRVYAFIFHYVKDKEESEELLQRVFLKVWEKRQKIDPSKSVSSFLFTISKNMVVDHFRRVKSRQMLAQEYKRRIHLEDHSTENTIIYNETKDFANAAIDVLPPKRGQIFRLSRFEGLSYSEIAQKLGISKNTVEVQMVKAIKTLREEYKSHYGPGG